MNKKRVTAEPSSELRLLAEQRLRDKLSIDPDALTSPQDMRRIIHELSVHQLELEMQQEELMHSRAELESSLDRYTSLYDFSPLGYLTISNKGKIIQANLTSSRMLGVDRSLLINKPFRHFIAPEYIPVYSALMESLFKLKAPGCCEIVLLSAEGIPAAEAQTPPQGHNIRVEAVHLSKSDDCQLILSDITELQKRSRALQAINNCNQALLHAQSEEELLQEICTIIVETGGYRMTWVGYALDDEEKSVLPVAKAGYDAGYLETLKVSWGDNEHGQGPGGSAVRTGRPFTTRNMQADPRFAPWRKEALARGYVSSLGLPMKSDDHVFGVLNIYSSMVDAFTEEEIALLASLTDNLAYGITMLRTRKHRDEAENEIRQSEARYKTLFQNKYIIMLIIDPESGRIIDANPAAVTFYGWEHDELCRMNISEINMLSEAEIKAEMQRARRDERNYFIFRHRRSDGSIRDVEVFSGPIILQGKSLLYSIIHDFTERKHLQEQLVANSERMNFILTSTNSGVWEAIMETNDAVWSDKMWALLGLKPNSCKPSFDNWLKTVIAEDRKTVEAAAAEALLKGVEFDCMWRTRDEDGSIRWLMSKGAPVRDADSRIVRYAGILAPRCFKWVDQNSVYR
ncbi:PAS domain S-box protein [Chlorobium sp. KB01]|uniref:PAS domain S-box protein n=1 Tax=Chlorobium sp. KB01 TaxID=1917528 RepID=UPI0009766C16|nr:PAS domain S-box protein [Chlorobium sp. KB01]